MKVLSPQEMREVDRSVPLNWAMDSILLMENAAIAAAEVIHHHINHPIESILIFCGPGNNGGDGLALARILHSRHREVSLCILFEEERLSGDTLKQWQMVQALNIPVHSPVEGLLLLEKKKALLIVDALLGTGLNRPPQGELLRIIQGINLSSHKVLSLDIPSGVDGMTGQIPDEGVRADYTVTFALPKRGNLLYPAYDYQGRLYISPISLPLPLAASTECSVQTVDLPSIPQKGRDAYKGSRGYGLVIGGCSHYMGAPGFAAAAALSTGMGYVHVASTEPVCRALAVREPELVLHPMTGAHLSLEHREELASLLQGKSPVILGLGLGRHDDTLSLVKELIPLIDQPLIIDGDGLYMIKGWESLLKKKTGPLILTPHPGEAARLLSMDMAQVMENPVDAALSLAERTGAQVILKLPHSLLATPEGQVYINLSGSPALATAGTGDVLCGVICSMLAMGLQPTQACQTGMFLHGLAGELVEKRLGSQGARTRDLLEELPRTMEYYRENRRELILSGNGRLIPVHRPKAP